MSDLSKTDQELVKLRTAKMSTKTIAMLMGGRWTEARVYNRLAQIDGQIEGAAPAAPPLHRADEDLPANPPPAPRAHARASKPSAPGQIEAPAALQARVEALAQDPDLVRALLSRLAIDMPAVVQGRQPPEELIGARETKDQPSPVAAAAPDRRSNEPRPKALARSARPTPADQPQGQPAPAPPLPLQARPQSLEITPARAAPRRLGPPLNFAPIDRPRRRGASIRLRPLTEVIAGYAARFQAANWPIDEIAELFDVSPEALEKVLA